MWVTARSCVVEMGVDSAWLDFGSSGVFFFFFVCCDASHGGGTMVVTEQWRRNARG